MSDAKTIPLLKIPINCNRFKSFIISPKKPLYCKWSIFWRIWKEKSILGQKKKNGRAIYLLQNRLFSGHLDSVSPLLQKTDDK